jgi:hypothetical protein
MGEFNNQKKENSKDRIGYGVKPPSLSFEDVIDITKVTGVQGGPRNSLDVLSRITGNSRSSSTFFQKIAALRIFGVIDTDKNQYVLTDLGNSIASPISYESQANAIIEAFSKNDNLRKIWEYYKGKRLPQQEEFLANAIVDILSIPKELKLQWAQYFKLAGIYAGLLEEREPNSYQVLSGYSPIIANEIKIQEELPQSKPLVSIEREETWQISPKGFSNISDQSWGILNMKSISNNRKAIFAIPEDLTQQDIDSLRIVIKGIDVQLEGLKKNEK